MNKIPRGKKFKMKKAKERYGDQEEDEKNLKLQLLGVKFILILFINQFFKGKRNEKN